MVKMTMIDDKLMKLYKVQHGIICIMGDLLNPVLINLCTICKIIWAYDIAVHNHCATVTISTLRISSTSIS